MAKQVDKCARRQEHDWETVKETRDTIIKQCKKCHGRKWVTRRN